MPRRYKGKKPDLLSMIENEDCSIATIECVMRKHYYSIFELNVADKDDTTPLSAALIRGNIELCELLIYRGAKIDGLTAEGYNLLHLAVAFCVNTEMLEFLIDNGVSPYHIALDKSTPISYARNHSRMDLIDLLEMKDFECADSEISDIEVPLSFSIYPIIEVDESTLLGD